MTADAKAPLAACVGVVFGFTLGLVVADLLFHEAIEFVAVLMRSAMR